MHQNATFRTPKCLERRLGPLEFGAHARHQLRRLLGGSPTQDHPHITVAVVMNHLDTRKKGPRAVA